MPLPLDVTGRGDEDADRLQKAMPRTDSIAYHGNYFQEFGRALESPCGIFLQEHFNQSDERLRNTLEVFDR